MNSRRRSSLLQTIRECAAILCAVVLLPGNATVVAAQDQQPAAAQEPAAVKIPADQLDSLVAPIALYPDALLSQTLVASTYPLEVVQLKQWLDQHKDLKGKALADAALKQDWDPSIQALAGLPDLVKQLADNIKWTTDLGNAFLAQQSDVMDAVQRMRKKAQEAGNLKSSEQQKVETKVVESKQVIIVQQASPEVVYVPATTQPLCMGLPSTRILRLPIRRQVTMRRAWPYRSVSALRWEPSGVVARVGDADGAGTTTSPSTITTTSSTTATGKTSTTRTAATAQPSSPQEVIVIGSTIRSIAGARHIRQVHRGQVRRYCSRRFPFEPAGERSPESGETATCGRRPRRDGQSTTARRRRSRRRHSRRVQPRCRG